MDVELRRVGGEVRERGMLRRRGTCRDGDGGDALPFVSRCRECCAACARAGGWGDKDASSALA